MISVSELQTAISQRIAQYNQQDNPLAQRTKLSLPLLQSLGHILAEDSIAPFDVPRQPLSAMDGFAVNLHHSDKSQPFTMVGESCAGQPFSGDILPQQGIRIFTGAVVPSDCDTVVMQEDTDFDFNKAAGYSIQILASAEVSLGKNIRQQGEEIRQHDVVLTQGKRLNPTDINLLANLGVANVTVFAPLTLGILATGDELMPIGETLPTPAHIYNGNTPSLQALLAKIPIVIKDYGIIPDDPNATRQAVSQAIAECEVIVSSAGVSVGDYDFLTTVVKELGQINHYKVAMKPGKPFVFGEFPPQLGQNSVIETENCDKADERSCTTGTVSESNADANSVFADAKKNVLYFGLPGNPLSTVVGCMQFVQPALWQMTGAGEDEIPKPLLLNATLTTDVKTAGGRQDYQRAIMENTNGTISVTPLASQDSHRIRQLSVANCFLIRPSDSQGAKAGDTVTVQPFPWAFG